MYKPTDDIPRVARASRGERGSKFTLSDVLHSTSNFISYPTNITMPLGILLQGIADWWLPFDPIHGKTEPGMQGSQSL